MKSYIQLIKEIINNQLSKNKDFTLIKIENITNPQIYLDLCNYFNSDLQKKNINFSAKLSDEKYKYWIKNNEFLTILDQMKKNQYVSEDERLTKWRNMDFNSDNKTNNNGTVIFLMGTECVEDQGGLEDFYTVNPEVVESYVKNNFSELFKKNSIELNSEESKIINNIYKNIFKVAQKDLLNLSNFIDTLNSDIKYYDLVNEIFGGLYEWWNIPNIKEILGELGKIKDKNKINIIEKAYKFSVRTSITKFQNDKKLKKLEADSNDFYMKNESEINAEFSTKFPGYNNFEEVIEDLKKYIQGIDLDTVKSKLFKCDFCMIDKILNLRESTKSNSSSTPKIYGDPFKALFLPILIELNKLDKEQKLSVNRFEININKIRLANTKTDSDEKEELKTKWKTMCRFLCGIETLFNEFCITSPDGYDVKANIYSETIDDKKLYTFDISNTKELINSGILKSSSQGDQKSKIFLEYSVYEEGSEKAVIKYEYEWHISETELWIYLFNFFNSTFEELIHQEKFLPIGITKKLNDAFEVKNEEEFIYSIKDLEIEYIDILKKYRNLITESYIAVEKIGEKFTRLMKEIYSRGIFNAIFNKDNQISLATDFITSYNKSIPFIIDDLKNNRNQDFTNAFSKVLLTLNSKEIHSKSIIGAMMPIYHPVMFEKVIDRYTYLANGFVEIYNEISEAEKNKFKGNVIVNKFDRYEQLATITSGASMMLGNNNEYVDSKMTYGFYSLYGEPIKNHRSSTVKVDFEVEEDFSDIIQINPVSTYISKTIADYLNTYPSKIDGINVGFINCNDYKLIITGLHDIITKVEKLNIKCKINVFIYTDDYTCSGKNYIKYWLENKFTEDDKVDVKVYLKYIDIMSITNISDYLKNNMLDLDLMFIEDILEVKELYSESVSYENKRVLENRYPSVYLPVPCNEERSRKVCISQNQFESEMNFVQLMTYLKSSIAKDANYRVIKRVELTNKIENLIDALHEKANWVVMLDENIDTQILSLKPNKIIGFSTGNGYFGEINTAISTKESHLIDLKNFLKRRLKSKFNNWSAKQIDSAAENCISYAKYLDGSEILKAINPEDESINNFLAYLLTAKSENIFDESYNKNYYIRKIISLDSHSHLFDNQLDLLKSNNMNSRPDFILLEIPKDNNSIDNKEININVKIIECKLAQESNTHINKAITQVAEGYDRLSKIWNKDSNSVDKRFWFNQLYRILAYNNSYENSQNDEMDFIISKLSIINEGNFNISFENFVYAYWIDIDTVDIYNEEYHQEENYEICIKSFGKQSIKKILIPDLCEEEEVEDTKGEDDNFGIEEASITIDGKDRNIDISKNHNDDTPEITNPNSTLSSPISNEPENIKVENVESKRSLLINPKIIELLEKSDSSSNEEEEKIVNQKIKDLKNRLEVKKIKIIPNDYIIGPDIIRIRVSLGMGVDFNQIEKYAEDMKLWLNINERPLIFIADGFVNIDIVRSKRQMIRMGDILNKINEVSNEYKDYEDKFYVALGEDILGNPNVIDMSDSNTPHLLIAGQTGSGKSVLLNSMLASIMSIYSPDQVEMILVDPKQVELTLFEESPYTKDNHIATESSEAVQLLQELVNEMERRYKLFRQHRVKNIADYNKKNPECKEKRILMVFDEYGAMIEESKEVRDKLEHAIKQLSQKARAAGIHMIICTQTPRADIITTTIRNNLTARIALRVSDSTASSLIIDTKGAESLLGKGDMLVKTAESSTLIRTKSPFIDEFEVEDIIQFIKKQ